MNPKKIILFTLSLCFASSMLNAQEGDLPRSSEVEITKSKPYPVVDAAYKSYFNDGEGGILSVKISGKSYTEFTFQKFEGDKLNLSKSKTEVIDIKGYTFEFIGQLKGKLYLFYSIYDKPNTKEQLFARSIDLENGGFNASKGELLLSTTRKIAGSYYYNYSARGKFSFDVSADEETFVIMYRYVPEVKDDSKNKDVLGMHVFSSELEKVWENDYEMSYNESRMDNLSFTVDSKGNGYFLIRKYKEEITKANRNDPNNQSIAILKADGEGTLEEIEFDLGDNFIDDVVLVENSKNDIICAGYYRKPKSWGVDGTFISTLSAKGELSEPTLYEFSLEFIKKNKRISEKQKNKMEKADDEGKLAMSNLYMRKAQVLKDGSIVLAGEIFYITTTTDSKGNTRTTYHYDDVIVTKINADGELGWNEKLPKRSTFESFKLFTSENYTYILFSDNPKNSTIGDENAPYLCMPKERQVITYRIGNEDGDKKYLALFGYKEIDGTEVYQYSLGRITGLSENSFAVEMYIKGKQDMMFKVNFDEQ